MSEGFIETLQRLFHEPYIALIVVIALVFDFVNGFHDAANSIATIVSTRVLRPFHAVFWAAWWNFAAARCVACPPCAGAWRVGSCGRGF